LVAAQSRIPFAQVWGGGDVASADGMRFVVPVRTIHAGPNPKYFNRGRGVTWYNLLSDQGTGLNAITVPGTLRDSLVLLSVVPCGRGKEGDALYVFIPTRGVMSEMTELQSNCANLLVSHGKANHDPKK
jgi:hypothetical protein